MGRLLLLLLSHRRIAPQLAIAWVLFFLSAGVTYAVPPVMLKPIMDELGISQAQVSLLPAAFLLTKGVCALPAGEALHRHGPHRCILLGTAALVLATAAYTQASRYWHFVALHACFGVCYSVGSLAANLCLCNLICPSTAKASAIGIVVTAFSVAGVAWPPLLAHLTEQRGWRTAYAVCPASLLGVGLPLALLLLRLGRNTPGSYSTHADHADQADLPTLALTAARESSSEEGEQSGGHGAAGCGGGEEGCNAATTAGRGGGTELATALDDASPPPLQPPPPQQQQPQPQPLARGAAGGVAGGARRRMRAASTSVGATLTAWRGAWWLREAAVWHLLAMSVELLYIVNAMGQLLVLYLSEDQGMTLSRSAAYSSAVFAASVVGKVGCGCGLDSPHTKWVGMASCALLLCGCLLVLQVERAPSGDTTPSGGGWRVAPVSSEAQLAAFVITYGLGYGASFALVQSHAAKTYGRREGFGRLQGALVLAQYVGGFGGVTLTALLRERTQSYLAPFALFPVLALMMCGHCYAISWGGSRCNRCSSAH